MLQALQSHANLAKGTALSPRLLAPAAPENPNAAATTVRLGSDFIHSHGYPSPSPIRLAALSRRRSGWEGRSEGCFGVLCTVSLGRLSFS